VRPAPRGIDSGDDDDVLSGNKLDAGTERLCLQRGGLHAHVPRDGAPAGR